MWPQNTEIEQVAESIRIVAPDGGENYWQPVPANGHISVRVAPNLVQMDRPFALGTQTVEAACYVREHSHPDHDEVVHFISGTGRAVLDGVEHRVQPGVTIFVGKTRRHMFIADDTNELHFLWLIVPNGLEDFFEAIGRPKRAGDLKPEPFARPDNIAEIERRTVFAPPPADGGYKP
jgi:quercetin dioxygenase-like cupin family protein